MEPATTTPREGEEVTEVTHLLDRLSKEAKKYKKCAEEVKAATETWRKTGPPPPKEKKT